MPIKPYPLAGTRHSVFGALAAFSATCFAGAFLTDLVYWQSTSVTWETFSVWLITIGLIIAVFAVLAGLIGYVRSRRLPAPPLRGLRVIASVIVIVLSIVNAFVHSRDGYTAVVPDGLTLSAIVFIVMLVTALASLMAQRQRVEEIA